MKPALHPGKQAKWCCDLLAEISRNDGILRVKENTSDERWQGLEGRRSRECPELCSEVRSKLLHCHTLVCSALKDEELRRSLSTKDHIQYKIRRTDGGPAHIVAESELGCFATREEATQALSILNNPQQGELGTQGRRGAQAVTANLVSVLKNYMCELGIWLRPTDGDSGGDLPTTLDACFDKHGVNIKGWISPARTIRGTILTGTKFRETSIVRTYWIHVLQADQLLTTVLFALHHITGTSDNYTDATSWVVPAAWNFSSNTFYSDDVQDMDWIRSISSSFFYGSPRYGAWADIAPILKQHNLLPPKIMNADD